MNPQISHLSFEKTNQLGKLVLDYLHNEPFLEPFHAGKPDLQTLLRSAALRRSKPVNRKVLAEVLRDQYEAAGIASDKVNEQIQKLEQENTFTVTTGQQTGILLGPTYTLMKILSTIRLSELLNKQGTDNHYIPVFWMATEDHDLEEIRHCWFRGEKYSWDTEQTGPVGRMNTQGIEQLIELIRQKAGKETSMLGLLDLFSEAYSSPNIAQATRKIVHSLFSQWGLLIIDADDARLKSSFSHIAGRDIIEGNSFERVSQSAERLSTRYHIQVNGRPINFFWIEDGIRTRIERAGETFKTLEGGKVWTKEGLLENLRENPQNFSPNVLMRPLYQETILPNIAYIGGAAEIAYWIELKAVFEFYEIPFPILLLRSSLTLLNQSNRSRINKYDLDISDIFLSQEALVKKVIDQRFGDELINEQDQELLVPLFNQLEKKAGNIASSKRMAVKAMQVRWEHDLQNFQKKLIRHKKKLESELMEGIEKVHSSVYPSEILQERQEGISDLVFKGGLDLLSEVYQSIDPLKPEMIIASI